MNVLWFVGGVGVDVVLCCVYGDDVGVERDVYGGERYRVGYDFG